MLTELPNQNSIDLLHQIRLLSLSLESAAKSGDIDSLQPILAEREQLIQMLSEFSLCDDANQHLQNLHLLDRDILVQMELAKSQIAQQFQSAKKQSSSARAYSANRDAIHTAPDV